jgi:hypothetical protein
MSQGASNNSGQGAGKSFVSFSRPAAQRIAKAVRVIEAGDRNQTGLTFDHPMPSGGKVFRVATFTGAWAIDSAKTVTFKLQTTTPNTVSATNYFLDLPDNGTRNCGIAKEGTAWHLIQWQWYSVEAATAATLTTAAIEFNTIPFAAIATSSTNKFTISITTCSTAAT